MLVARWRLSVGGGRLLVVGRMLAITCGGLLVAGIPLLVGGCWLGVVGGRDCRRGGSRAARMGVPRSGPESCHGHPEQNHRGRSWLCSGTGKMRDNVAAALRRHSMGTQWHARGRAMVVPAMLAHPVASGWRVFLGHAIAAPGVRILEVTICDFKWGRCAARPAVHVYGTGRY